MQLDNRIEMVIFSNLIGSYSALTNSQFKIHQ